MLRNVASQKWRVYAWDATTGLAKTGDAANISARITKDDGSPAATDDAAPSEVDSTNEPGYYDFTLTQAESDAAKASLSPKSSTSNIVVIACPPVVYTRPQYFSLASITSGGLVNSLLGGGQVRAAGDVGNITEDATIVLRFSTISTALVPVTLGGTPAISVYKDSTTQSTAGVTLTVDYDSVTGLHHVAIDTSADAFYEAGKNYTVVITTGTVSGASVVGMVVGSFSIENRFQEVDVVKLGGGAQSLLDLKDFADDGYDPSTNKLQGLVLADTVTTLTNAPSDSSGTTTLLSRLSAARAGYLDALDGHTAQTGDSYAIVNSGTHGNAALKTLIDAVDDLLDTEVAAILADTNELQADLADGGRLDLLIDAIKAVTDAINAAQAEPTGVPAVDATPLVKIGWLFMALRNKVTVDATKKTFYDDGDAAEWEKDLSDDGTTYTESKGNAI